MVANGIGKVRYIANAPFTKATETPGAGGIGGYLKKKFKVEVMFITNFKVIYQDVDGFKERRMTVKCLETMMWRLQGRVGAWMRIKYAL